MYFVSVVGGENKNIDLLMLASVCILERTDAIRLPPSRKFSETIRLPHINRSRKTSSKIGTF